MQAGGVQPRWRKTICCIYSCLNIDRGADCVAARFVYMFVTRCRLGSCTSGSSPRSAGRRRRGRRRCRRRGPSRTVRRATRASLSPTHPPASPARGVSTPTEQVHESDRSKLRSSHVNIHAMQMCCCPAAPTEQLRQADQIKMCMQE